MADFENLAVRTEPYYETIPKKGSSVPSSTMSFDAHEENNHLPPPGSVPTPVVIASKISEHQGTGGITPSMLLGRRSSLESKRDRPMPAKTPNLPSNISMTRGNRELSPHSLATAAVNIQERRSQMLANLPPGSHPLEGGEPACVRHVPIRSVSFKDMEPEKSRMEALSKLGLIGKTPNSTASTTSPNNSAYKVSSGASSPISNPTKVSLTPSSPISNPTKLSLFPRLPISSPNNVNISANSASNGANKVSAQSYISNNSYIGHRKNSNPSSVAQSTFSSGYEPKIKSEVTSNNFNYYGGKSAAITPKDTTASVNQERRSSIPPSSTEVKQTDFNSYGGKSVILNPSTNAKADSIQSASENTPEPPETLFNSYGGRSRVMNRQNQNSDVPDGMNYTHSPTNTVTPTMHHSDPTKFIYPSEQNTYDARPKAPTLQQSDPVNQPITRTRPATLLPPTAPRPPCPSGSLKPRPDPVPPEILSKPAPSFRNQGVTVQFSGGTTGEARRDALRRLGLLKNTS